MRKCCCSHSQTISTAVLYMDLQVFQHFIDLCSVWDYAEHCGAAIHAGLGAQLCAATLS